ncbi:complex I NDUFA9 subunit family protein [Aerophototrophica crusticola]|uniref:Complex I NDUFA9 subunit family protein n=1 Tax=Aerophototrophica crusticola TaxID=1709002 RepID=A0A858R4I6_9PROT|nr:complex I NDUFA9 subunit family protein [Rhodospirillaceae bacterium B3]
MVYRYRGAVVFGGSGFLGRHIIQRLAKTGCVIRVPSRHPADGFHLRTLGVPGQIVPLATNIHDDQVVAAAVEGADLVINLIGILAPSGKKNTFDAVQAEAAARIARAAKAAGVERYVHMSALGADANSASAYARSKAAGEQAVLAAFPEATIFRPSIVFGPSDNFFNRFAHMARVLPFLPLIGGGHTRFQPVYVGDVADAVMAALSTTESKGKTYELGGPFTYSFKELLQLTVREIGKPKKWMLNIPFGLAKLQGAILQYLPGKLLTPDQVELLKTDNVVSGRYPGLPDLGIDPTAAEVILPTYLDKFRIGGRYAQSSPQVARPSAPFATKPDATGRGGAV